MANKTIGEVYSDRIAQGLTPEEIRSRFAAMLADGAEVGSTPAMVRQNLGYVLGYFDEATRREWYAALPDVNHPIFGAAFGRGYEPTPEEVFAAGQKWAQEGMPPAPGPVG